jgi:hypothetical protein
MLSRARELNPKTQSLELKTLLIVDTDGRGSIPSSRI